MLNKTHNQYATSHAQQTVWLVVVVWTSLTWSGCQLVKVTKENNSYEIYAYNQDGLRTSRKLFSSSNVLTNTYEYTWVDGVLEGYRWQPSGGAARNVHFHYDENGEPYAFTWDSQMQNSGQQETRYFTKNLQGDIIGVHWNADNVPNAEYSYDAWGSMTTISGGGSNGDVVSLLRYRGYQFDKETGLYYCQSRYYNSKIARWLNADEIVVARNCLDSVHGANLFAYCNNEPIMNTDPTGYQPLWARIIQRMIKASPGYKIGKWATMFGLFPKLFKVAGFERDKKGIYHARQDCIQQHFGYNYFYDIAFDLGTDMLKETFPFTYNDKDYIFWAWKGDYYNLGAGAELGIYQRFTLMGAQSDHYIVNKSLALPMKLYLLYKGREIIKYEPSGKVWWLTGFNPLYQNVKAKKLTAIYGIDFSGSKFSRGMFKAFYDIYGPNGSKRDTRWRFDKDKYLAAFHF